MNISEDIKDLIQEAVDPVDGAVITDYVGRGPTKECVAIKFPEADDAGLNAFEIGARIAEVLMEHDQTELIGPLCGGALVDSLGKGFVIYFPNISVSKMITMDLEVQRIETKAHVFKVTGENPLDCVNKAYEAAANHDYGTVSGGSVEYTLPYL
jgi:hypothetical protein